MVHNAHSPFVVIATCGHRVAKHAPHDESPLPLPPVMAPPGPTTRTRRGSSGGSMEETMAREKTRARRREKNEATKFTTVAYEFNHHSVVFRMDRFTSCLSTHNSRYLRKAVDLTSRLNL